MEKNRLREFLKRVRIALPIIVGFVLGKVLAQTVGHHASEFFIGGFMLGIIATQLIYAAFERPFGSE